MERHRRPQPIFKHIGRGAAERTHEIRDDIRLRIAYQNKSPYITLHAGGGKPAGGEVERIRAGGEVERIRPGSGVKLTLKDGEKEPSKKPFSNGFRAEGETATSSTRTFG